MSRLLTLLFAVLFAGNTFAATGFPTSLDSLPNPTSTTSMSDPALSHSAQHTNLNDAMEAVQATVGVTGSAVTTTHDYRIATLESKIGVRPEDYGANTVPGVTDMSAAFSAALAALAALPAGGTLILSPTDYALGSVVAHTGSINIDGNGARLLPSTTASAITLTGTATPIITTTASAVINLGADHVTLTSVAGISAGQIIKLVSDTLWYYDNRGTLKKGEMHVVDRVSGNDVYFTDVTYDSYNSPTETVAVTTYEPAEFHANNLLIEYPANTAATSGISYTLAKNSTMDNVSVKNASIAGIGIIQSVGTIINGGTVEGCNNNVDGGYGISIGDSYNTKISKVVGRHNWRTVDFTGGTIPSRVGLVHGCSADGGGLGTSGAELNLVSTGFGTHGGAEGIVFSNNTATNVYSAFVSRGNNISLFNNTLVGDANSFCEMSYGNNLLIDGNRSESLDSQRTSYTTPALDTFRAERFLYVGATVESTAKITVTNNYAKVVSRFVYSAIDLTGFTAMGNKIDFDPAGAADAVAVYASANNTLASSVIRNNSVEATTTGTVYKVLTTVCGISNQVDGCGPYSGYRRSDDIITEAAAKPSTVLNGGATTGTIDADSDSLVVSAATGLAAGQSITIVGVTGTKRILTLVGTTATLDSVSDASVVGAAVSYYLADAVRGTVVKNWYPYAYSPKGWIALSATTWAAFGPAYGTTAQRPTLDAYDAGFVYYDSTIAKPIFWSGSAWLLADGTGA